MHPEGLVSAIVPVYNGAAYVRAAVLSVLQQTYPHVEVVVVNDGSPDDSEQVIADLLRDPRVTYFKQRNRGVAGARNAGIAAARGDFIAFLDQDDLWLPDKLERQMRCFAQHPEVALVHGNVRFIDATGARLTEREDRWDADARQAVGHCFPLLFSKNRLAMLTVCMRRAAFDATGPFREDVPGVDDYEYWLRLSRRHGFAHVDHPVALYRLHGSNESRSTSRRSRPSTACWKPTRARVTTLARPGMRSASMTWHR
jgi:glycosyltransferase involved in cell wall biosynthesis